VGLAQNVVLTIPDEASVTTR